MTGVFRYGSVVKKLVYMLSTVLFRCAFLANGVHDVGGLTAASVTLRANERQIRQRHHREPEHQQSPSVS